MKNDNGITLQLVFNEIQKIRMELKEDVRIALEPIREDIRDIKKNYALKVELIPIQQTQNIIKTAVFGFIALFMTIILTGIVYFYLIS